MTTQFPPRAAILAFSCFFVFGCVTPAPDVRESTAPDTPSLAQHAPAPWTDYFMPAAVLAAIDVTITGPPGLLDHVASRIDPAYHSQSVETVPTGLRQTYATKVVNAPEIAAFVDGLEIAVLRRLVILEQPGATSVRIVASGEAYWKELDGSELRQGRIVLEAPIAAR